LSNGGRVPMTSIQLKNERKFTMWMNYVNFSVPNIGDCVVPTRLQKGL